MKRVLLGFAVMAAVAVAVPAAADTVRVDDPTGVFTDEFGNAGYVEADTHGAARVCNENENTPAGDSLTGYIWVNADGESTTPSYGNANVGAGDADGADDGNAENGTEDNDCP